MTEKETENIKVGCGEYFWHYDLESNLLVNRLKITIEEMVTLSSDRSEQLLKWSGELAYPWCDSSDILKSIPNFEYLNWIKIKFS